MTDLTEIRKQLNTGEYFIVSKPRYHKMVSDLCDEVESLRAEIQRLESCVRESW